MKKRNGLSILLYLLGIALFVTANSAVVSGSPINLTYVQRVILCSAAVCSIGTAPFMDQSKTRVGMVVKLVLAGALIWCIFTFGGFRITVWYSSFWARRKAHGIARTYTNIYPRLS